MKIIDDGTKTQIDFEGAVLPGGQKIDDILNNLQVGQQSFTHKFLDEYKKLERKLRSLAGANDQMSFRDVIKECKKQSIVVTLKEEIIFDLSALRNVFAHSDREKYIAEVNQVAYQLLAELLKLLEHPPTVLEFFKAEVYCANVEDVTETVLKKMQEKLFTHVPIYDGDKFKGILSETTIFDWLIDSIKQDKSEFYKRQIKDIKPEYLNSANNLFEVIKPGTDIFSVLKIFEDAINNQKRLGVVLITPTGSKDEKPIGIITAWDLPRIRNLLNK
jgi:CBS domain-containing protein